MAALGDGKAREIKGTYRQRNVRQGKKTTSLSSHSFADHSAADFLVCRKAAPALPSKRNGIAMAGQQM